MEDVVVDGPFIATLPRPACRASTSTRRSSPVEARPRRSSTRRRAPPSWTRSCSRCCHRTRPPWTWPRPRASSAAAPAPGPRSWTSSATWPTAWAARSAAPGSSLTGAGCRSSARSARPASSCAPALPGVRIGGAVQHVSGLGDPAHVIAVNPDASCPMMSIADLAVVTDAPALVAELARRLPPAPRRCARCLTRPSRAPRPRTTVRSSPTST